jgi:hypothetical protein
VKRWILAAVGLLCLALIALHVSGGRDAVGWLSGSAPVTPSPPILGLAYVVAWLGVVVIAPIAVVAIVLDTTCGKLGSRWRAWRRR